MEKPSSPEEEYFAKQEAEKKRRLALERVRQLAAAERERTRVEHFMRCPKCGLELEEVVYRGVKIDKCFHCNGMWLDEGEVKALSGHDAGRYIRSIVDLFFHP